MSVFAFLYMCNLSHFPPYLFVACVFLCTCDDSSHENHFAYWAEQPCDNCSCFSAPVAIRAGCFPETGHTEAGGSRLCVCSRAHISRQNSGGRIRHRPLPETHDEVRICRRSSISSALSVGPGAASQTHFQFEDSSLSFQVGNTIG